MVLCYLYCNCLHIHWLRLNAVMFHLKRDAEKLLISHNTMTQNLIFYVSLCTHPITYIAWFLDFSFCLTEMEGSIYATIFIILKCY